MGVDAPGGDDAPLPGNGFGSGADDNIDIGLNIRVSGLADPGDTPVFQPEIGFNDAPVI